MLWIIEDARFVCDHRGRVSVKPTQDLVRIGKRRVLVRDNPENRPISGCTISNLIVAMTTGIRPCKHSLKVYQGYSSFIRIGGQPVCLDNLLGHTDGTPPQTVNYKIADPAQRFVASRE